MPYPPGFSSSDCALQSSMHASLKRKSEEVEVPLEWVDDHEWNAIQIAFDAVSKPGVDWRNSSQIPPRSMLSSILPPTSAASHRVGLSFSAGHCSVPSHISESFHGAGVVCPTDVEVSRWRRSGLPVQLPSRNLRLGGGTRTKSANECPEFSSDNCASGERIEDESRLPPSPLQKVHPDPCLQETVVTGTAADKPTSSEIVRADAGQQNSDLPKVTVRRLPSWIEQAGQFILSIRNSSSVEHVSGHDGTTAKKEPTRAEVQQSNAETGSTAMSTQQTGNGTPVLIQLEQPQAGIPWGLQPSSYVDEKKPRFAAMRFRGQIVYSTTVKEVDAATQELWQRLQELQETTQGAVPIGFDLEWRTSFGRGELPRKVAVLQLCLDGRRCDVMQIIYSGIPLSLKNLLEAPSTLKVGVGVYGDASKLQQDYNIVIRKLVDLRVVANKKMINSKQWSLSSLALELTGKHVEKVQSIRCGDWEALPLSQPQLQYAATDAFASLHLYQVLQSFPTPEMESNQSQNHEN